MALITLGSLFVEREAVTNEVIQFVSGFLPVAREQENFVGQTIDRVARARGEVGLVAFIILVWSALRFLKVLIRSTNRAWRSAIYNWWQLPAKSFMLLGIVGSASLLGILAPVAARLLENELAPAYFSQLFELGVGLIPRLVLFCCLAMLYKLAPSRHTRFAEVWIAALAVTLLLWLGETAFVIYVRDLARFNVLHGTLGGMVAFLLWIYLSGLSYVLGACLCAAQAELCAESQKSHAPKKRGQRESN